MLFNILKNILSLLTGRVVAKLLAIGGAIFMARRLGVEAFGAYGTVMAYLTLFAAFADAGISTVTIRDVAQDKTRNASYFSHSLILRLALSVLAYAAFLTFSIIWETDKYSNAFILTCGVFLFPEALRLLGISLLSAYERMDVVAMLDVLSTVARYTPFIIAIVIGGSLQTGFLFFVISWVGLGLVYLVITKTVCFRHGMSFPFDRTEIQSLFTKSLPFGVFFVLSIIYFRVDIIMLSSMKGDSAVGFYNGAYKFIEAAMFLPVSIINVLLPLMSRSFLDDKASYGNLYFHSTRLLGMAILPVIIFISFFAKEIILLMYKTPYLPSAPALSLLVWTLFFIFINAPVGNIIATSNTMIAFLPYAIGNTLLNIVLNFLLIPQYSFMGASFTTLLTEITGFITQLYFANRVLGNARQMLRIIGKLVLAGGITSLAVYLANMAQIFPLTVIVLIVTYLASLFVLNVIQHEDKQLCRVVLKNLRKSLKDRR